MSSPLDKIAVVGHPLLDPRVFITEFPRPLADSPTPGSLASLLTVEAAAPIRADETVKPLVRDLLRHAGFKPTGRSKPASEYLRQAAVKGNLRSINLAVDACNAVSLHSGLPISVVDLDKAGPPFAIRVAEPGSSYVFNPSGQVMDIGNLLCLFDRDGPCANAVKDSQRTKTDDQTRRTLSVIWGTVQLPGYVDRALAWYRELLGERATVPVPCRKMS